MQGENTAGILCHALPGGFFRWQCFSGNVALSDAFSRWQRFSGGSAFSDAFSWGITFALSAVDRQTQLARRRVHPDQPYHPAYVVWELTLRCDQACHHCGSRALLPRPNELNTVEALAVVEQLAAMQAKEVVLIGGEAYLHPGFLQIIAALAAQGITPVMTTGGMGLTSERAQAMARAGLKRVSVSIDGLEAHHNAIRKRKDSFAQTTRALQAVVAAGLDASANTHFNRFNQSLHSHHVLLEEYNQYGLLSSVLTSHEQ